MVLCCSKSYDLIHYEVHEVHEVSSHHFRVTGHYPLKQIKSCFNLDIGCVNLTLSCSAAGLGRGARAGQLLAEPAQEAGLGHGRQQRHTHTELGQCEY